jgi:hypothetical protein
MSFLLEYCSNKSYRHRLDWMVLYSNFQCKTRSILLISR